MPKSYMYKLAAVLISFIFMFNIIVPAEATQLKTKIPFGAGSNPGEEKQKQKDENKETKSFGTALGLIVLGACIVAAAVIITNKADDIVDRAEDKTDSLTEKAEDIYNDNISEMHFM